MALNYLQNHAEDALSKSVECLTFAGSCMVKKCYKNKKVMKAKWFDEDCRQQQQQQKELFETKSIQIYKEWWR